MNLGTGDQLQLAYYQSQVAMCGVGCRGIQLMSVKDPVSDYCESKENRSDSLLCKRKRGSNSHVTIIQG